MLTGHQQRLLENNRGRADGYPAPRTDIPRAQRLRHPCTHRSMASCKNTFANNGKITALRLNSKPLAPQRHGERPFCARPSLALGLDLPGSAQNTSMHATGLLTPRNRDHRSRLRGDPCRRKRTTARSNSNASAHQRSRRRRFKVPARVDHQHRHGVSVRISAQRADCAPLWHVFCVCAGQGFPCGNQTQEVMVESD